MCAVSAMRARKQVKEDKEGRRTEKTLQAHTINVTVILRTPLLGELRVDLVDSKQKKTIIFPLAWLTAKQRSNRLTGFQTVHLDHKVVC